jgi:putative ABC transport system substrate-binding protein
MKRRDLISLLGGAAAAWPFPARAQPGERMRRIGFLRAAPPPERELAALLGGLADHGYTQGRNFVLVPQWGDGRIDRLPELAVALVNAGVDIIVAAGVISARAAAALTTTIPIVMTAGADPFAGGLVKTLARPGGNVTGFTAQSAEVAGKLLEILKDMVPGLVRVAVLAPRVAWDLFRSAEGHAAKALAVDIVYIDLSEQGTEGAALRQAISTKAQGALLRVGPFFSSTENRKFIDLAAEFRFPVVYERRDYVEQGGLVSYGTDNTEIYRGAAGYVARILAGAHPGDLPVQQPTKFELAVNLKTAKALGLTIPDKLLAVANEVIE